MIGNPVFHRELFLRFRFRQSRPVFIGIVVLILLLIAGLNGLILWWLSLDHSAISAHTAFDVVISLQYLLICLVAPSITANAITQEKEQQTWEMLVFTRLVPSEIILGKLLARLIAVFGILLLFLPISLLCMTLANAAGVNDNSYISLGQLFAVYLVMSLSAIFFATFGLFASWLLKRTLYAIMVSYTFVIGILCLATVLVTLVLGMVYNDQNFTENCPIMWLNPVMLLFEAFTINAPNTSYSSSYLVYGLLFYIAFTALMIWRMIAGFRRFVYE